MKILVAGAGIAGMAAALALESPDREIVVIERDPPPPNVPMDDVFETWQRRGVAQLKHAHGYPARLMNIIRDRHPILLKALLDAGAIEMGFADLLPEALQRTYRPKHGDEDMRVLLSRRTTLEFIVRDYAVGRPGISFMTGIKVQGLVAERGGDGVQVAKAMKLQQADGTQEQMAGDLIIDASGRSSRFPAYLAEYGITPEIEEEPVGIAYFTRFYRLCPGEKFQWSVDNDRVQLDFLRGGVLPADNGNFAVMFMVPIENTVLQQRMLKPEVFDRVCAAFPHINRWTSRAKAVNRPLGMGDLKNKWHHWHKNGEPLIKNFFAIGDAAVRTNPAFGRGCSFAFVESDLLAEVLRTNTDPIARAKVFERRTDAALRPYFLQIVRQDKMIIEEAKHTHEPNYRPNLKTRLLKSFAEGAVVPANATDIVVRRALSRSAHMLEAPNAWMKKPGVLVRVILKWLAPKSTKPKVPPPPIGYAQLMALVEAA